MHQIYSQDAANRKRKSFLTSWGRLPFILERFFSRAVWNHTAEKKRKCKFAFSSHSVWLWTWSCVFLRRSGERPTQRGQSSHCRAPQPKGQLSTTGGGKNNGASDRAVWKKDESGSLSISTACRHCSEPQGLRGGGRADSRELKERRKKKKKRTEGRKTS